MKYSARLIIRTATAALLGTVLAMQANAAGKKFAGDSQPYNSSAVDRALPQPSQTRATEPVQAIQEEQPVAIVEPVVDPVEQPAPKPVAVKKLKPIDPEYQNAKAVKRAKILAAARKNAKVDTIVTGSVRNCAKPTTKYDRDIKKNMRGLKGACIELHTVRDGKRSWKIYTISKGKSGPLWAVLHDNENAAFDGAVHGMNKRGGTIVAVETGERRTAGGKDPNRNFGTKCGNASKYTKFMMRLVGKARGGVISMHSNAVGYSGGGGSGHISIRRKSRVLIANPARKPKPEFRNEDTFVLVPGKGKMGSSAKRKISKLNAKGVHAMYERVTKAGNDCSMSNHLVLKGKSRYVTIEVRHGDSKTAKRLIPYALGVL